jgi:hypothetical protein
MVFHSPCREHLVRYFAAPREFVGEFAERRGDQHLALFLESAHAAAIGLRGAAKQDHWPAILLGIGEAGETVHHAWAGHGNAGAGAVI